MQRWQDWQTARQTLAQWGTEGQTVGLIPTMGALHAGHMSLVTQAKSVCDRVVVSIFVNPRQFGPNEDFASYPRTLEADAQLCAEHGVDGLYAPSVETVYPEGHATVVHVAGLGDRWCGASRPGHFDGVATVVAKLLLQLLPDIAFFGEKDYQQLAILKRMATDLHLLTLIHGLPTVREADGLALSSRNRYLTPEERQIAPTLHQSLQAARQALLSGTEAPIALAGAKDTLLKAGFAKIDYLGLADAATLEPLTRLAPGRPARLLAAAWLGKARLIDNVPVI